MGVHFHIYITRTELENQLQAELWKKFVKPSGMLWKNEYLPTKEIWEKVARGFENVANFPHWIGRVEGKHVRIVCPMKSGSMYYIYKDYNSIVLMGIADSNYRFVYVHMGSYGKYCDSSIF